MALSHGQTDLQKGLCGSCQEEEGTNLRGRARESTSQEAMGVQIPSEAPLTLFYTLPPWLLTTEGLMPSSVTSLTLEAHTGLRWLRDCLTTASWVKERGQRTHKDHSLVDIRP